MGNKINIEMTYKELPKELYWESKLTAFQNISTVLFNKDLADQYKLPDENFFENLFNEVFFVENMTFKPIAQAYAAHQYGYFRNLGDGRALLLGEILDEEGKRADIHIKGTGVTRFSRGGDGKATLSSMLREYIASEAMKALNIPTTRSLAVISTGEYVLRNDIEKGGLLLRLADSHIRIGTFQYASQLDRKVLKKLADYTILRHYPNLIEVKERYIELFRDIMKRQGILVAKWQSVGFVHGVMNTDNVLLCGQTIDFGPFAFINEYDEDAVFSSIDRYGRYSFGNQKDIMKWNLARLGEAMIGLEENKQDFQKKLSLILEDFDSIFEEYYYKEMAQKLGLVSSDESKLLVEELLSIMKSCRCDYTNTFVALSRSLEGKNIKELKNIESLLANEDFKKWYEKWKNLIFQSGFENGIELMKKKNPIYILRNSLLEEALKEGSENRMDKFFKLLEEIQNPFDDGKIIESHNNFFTNNNYVTYCGT